MEKKNETAQVNGQQEAPATAKREIKVIQVFRDKYDKTVRYKVGQVLEFDAERAADVVNRKLAVYVEPEG